MNFLSALSEKYHTYFYSESKSETEAKPKNHTISKEALKSLGSAGTAIFLSNYSPGIGEELLDQTGLCPSSLFSKGTTEFFAKYLHYPNWVSLCGGNAYDYSWFYFKGPLLEELVDRVLLQELSLKQAPKVILKKISPNHVHLVDHIAARIARVFTSSLFFALHHSWAHTCTSGDMYHYIITGIALGALQEMSGHPLHNLIAHCGTNYIILNAYYL